MGKDLLVLVTPHKRLLMKLDFYGIRNKTKEWISSFLTKRFQRVVVSGHASDWKPVLSGAPQGTVLGPHLFLSFINDIHENISSTTRLFADDCLVYKVIKSPEDERQLQNDLDKLVDWAQTWGMRFNPSKCKTMRITRKRNPGTANYNMMGVDLEETDNITYLGVQFQNDLRWNKQTQHATSKATRVLNFIRRNFYDCAPPIKEKLYQTLVRPHLDYATASWDPYTKKNIDDIEKIQRRAARFVTNKHGKDYSITAILNDLDWTPMEVRRKTHRLTTLFKMINNDIDINHNKFIQAKTSRHRRGHSNQFQQRYASTDAFANSFFIRTTSDWNKLLPATVNQPTANTFKTAVQSDPSVKM